MDGVEEYIMAYDVNVKVISVISKRESKTKICGPSSVNNHKQEVGTKLRRNIRHAEFPIYYL